MIRYQDEDGYQDKQEHKQHYKHQQWHKWEAGQKNAAAEAVQQRWSLSDAECSIHFQFNHIFQPFTTPRNVPKRQIPKFPLPLTMYTPHSFFHFIIIKYIALWYDYIISKNEEMESIL